MKKKKTSNTIWAVIGYSILLFMVAFLVFSPFNKLQNKTAIAIRGLKHTTSATIDSVSITHSNSSINPHIIFYYHYSPHTDTTIHTSTRVKHYNNFSYNADKLKQQHSAGSNIPVYYKLKSNGRYVSNIYPQNDFFHWNSFLLAGFIEYYILLAALCFLFYYFYQKKTFKSALKYGMGIATAIFLLLWFTYSASPKLQQTVFEKTHPQFVKVKTSAVYDWAVKFKSGSNRSRGYHYISAKFDYTYNNKQYQSTIYPVKIRSIIAQRKIAQTQLNNLQANHNNIVYIDKKNPEYAVLFALDKPVFLYSTFTLELAGLIVIIVIIMLLSVLLAKKTKQPATPKKFGIMQFLKLMGIVMLITAAIILIILLFIIK